MKSTLLIAAFAMTIASSSMAMTNTTGNEDLYRNIAKYHMEKADRNNDNRLSKAEVMAFAGQEFEKADLNGNNQLSIEELQTRKRKEYKDIMRKYKN
jgi:hypothetical protein